MLDQATRVAFDLAGTDRPQQRLGDRQDGRIHDRRRALDGGGRDLATGIAVAAGDGRQMQRRG